jgi:hypothetical protein
MMAKRAGTFLGEPIHRHMAACRVASAIAEIKGGSELYGAGSSRKLSGDSPACSTLRYKLFKRCCAQATAGGEKGNSFEQIGFAGPIGAGEHNTSTPGIEPEVPVIAKARKGDAIDGERGGHTRMGIST